MTQVIASVRINRQDIAVKVLSVFKTGDGRKVAHVEALPVNGREIAPFTNYSVGGPYQSNSANIRIEYLVGISRVEEPTPQEIPAPAPTKRQLGIVRVNGNDVTVEVTEVYTGVHGERLATVRALPEDGRRITPFLNCSTRGYPYTDTGRVPADEIRGLSLVDLQSVGGAA